MNTLKQKLNDLDNVGAVVELTAEEAEMLGLTIETAENEEEALNARFDEVENG
jgi:hypothetical protein